MSDSNDIRDEIRARQSAQKGAEAAIEAATQATTEKPKGKRFNLDHLARVERNHYYDNSYHMTYVPKLFAAHLRPYIHENRMTLLADKAKDASAIASLDDERIAP